jgi:hypothetical protein
MVYLFVILLFDSNKNNLLNKKLNSYFRMRINTHSCAIKILPKDFEHE